MFTGDTSKAKANPWLPPLPVNNIQGPMCYETLFVHNKRIYIITKSVGIWLAFPVWILFANKAGRYQSHTPFRVLHSRVAYWCYQ